MFSILSWGFRVQGPGLRASSVWAPPPGYPGICRSGLRRICPVKERGALALVLQTLTLNSIRLSWLMGASRAIICVKLLISKGRPWGGLG